MTVDEIKIKYSMREIVERYGLHINKAGFISCPFHIGDNSPSMKIYPKDFYCHACHVGGDIFTFVQKMDNLSFKEAFQLLGGNYEQSFSARYKADKAKRERQKELEYQNRKKKELELNQTLIGVYRKYLDRFEPLSDEWTECYNALQFELYRNGYLTEKR